MLPFNVHIIKFNGRRHHRTQFQGVICYLKKVMLIGAREALVKELKKDFVLKRALYSLLRS
jgi:hypothetical protein